FYAIKLLTRLTEAVHNEKFVYWSEKLLQFNDVHGMGRLARYYAKTKVNIPRAIELYEKLNELGDVYALCDLATLYEENGNILMAIETHKANIKQSKYSHVIDRSRYEL